MRIHRRTKKKGKERKKKKRKRVRPPERQSAMSAEPSSVQDSEGQKKRKQRFSERVQNGSPSVLRNQARTS